MWINTERVVSIYCKRSVDISGDIRYGQTTKVTYNVGPVYPVFPAVVGNHSAEVSCPFCKKKATVIARVTDRATRIRELRWIGGCMLFLLGALFTVPMFMMAFEIKLNESEHYSIFTRILAGLGGLIVWSGYTAYLVWGIPFFEKEGYDAVITQGNDKMRMHHEVSVSGK